MNFNLKRCFPCCPESLRIRAPPRVISEESITEPPLNKAIENVQALNSALILQRNQKKDDSTFDLSYYMNLLEQIKELLIEYQRLEDDNKPQNSQVDKESSILNVYPELFFSKEYLEDNYTIIRHLDKGQFSNVFLARVLGRDKKNLLSVIKISKNYQRPTSDYMVKEHNISRLSDNCRFITKHVDHFESQLYSFHVMEFLAGGNLAFHLEKLQKFTEEQVKFISAEIICGLLVLHKEGIIHCDIKLENILFDLKGHSKIADFDQCQMMKPYRSKKSSDYLKNLLFEPILNIFSEYYAPECILSTGIDISLDYWSLGILVYKMLTGDFPFHDYNSILNNNVPIMSNSSEAANNFVFNLLIRDQNERLSSKNNNIKIKEHDFYSGIDWIKLNNGELEPLFKPAESDSANFRQEIKKERLKSKKIITPDNYCDHLSKEFKEISIAELKSIEFTKLLDQGTFGKIYLGRLEQSNKRLYVIKSLNKSVNKLFINFK